MFKLYSKGCQYGLRVLAYVLVEQGGSPVTARDLCELLGIPESYSRKVLQALVQGGLLEAHRGPGGGYSLTRDPHEITLLEVIYAVDGEDCFDACILGLDTCSPKNPCPLHNFWRAAREHLIGQLRACTLAEVGREVLEGDGGDILPGLALPARPGTPPMPHKTPGKPA